MVSIESCKSLTALKYLNVICVILAIFWTLCGFALYPLVVRGLSSLYDSYFPEFFAFIIVAAAPVLFAIIALALKHIRSELAVQKFAAAAMSEKLNDKA